MEINTKSRTEPLVEVKDLVKYYGDRLAVDNISFDVGKGEILGFLGPNGAGKTTTMRIITGYMPPTRGEVKVCGIDVLEKPVEAKRLIGYLPENPPVYSDMTVISYLKFVAKLKRVPKNKIKERLDFVLEKCGLKDVKGRIIGNLSRGYRQRVGIAQAIIHDPQIMIFDEPTVGLDPQQVVEIRNLIKEISKDKTVILSTHILSEVTKICSRVIIISGGRLVFSEYLDRIGAIEGRRKFLFWFSSPTEAQAAYNTIADIGLKKIKDVKLEDSKISILSEDDIRKDLIKDLVSKSGVVPIKVDEEVPSLEEVYLKVVSGANPQE
jgi:ABC-2 type transport system ATP-binding protein